MDPMVVLNEILSGLTPYGMQRADDGHGPYEVHRMIVHVNEMDHAILEVIARHQGDGKWDVFSVGCRQM